MIYINGIKATKQDLATLNEYVKQGKAQIKEIRTTQKGATAITVEA